MGSGTEEEDEGIIPRALKHIFHHLKAIKATHVANLRVSMIELYNDECKDLLHPEIPSRDIVIREDKHGRIFFTGAREEAITSVRGALDFLDIGNINRTTAETLMNITSSRSHAIFTVSLELMEYGDGRQASRSFIHAKLHLVDLAGSERAKRTGAVGTRFKESVGINQGLLALGKVIRALTSTPVTHVPYRESKLTRFLQDSLGGNSRTLLLACVSCAEINTHETISTLAYAQRARAVHNKLIANISRGVEDIADSERDTEIGVLREQIAHLAAQLAAKDAQVLPPMPPTTGAGGGSSADVLRAVRHTVQQMTAFAASPQEVQALGSEALLALRDVILKLDDQSVRRSLRTSLQALGQGQGTQEDLEALQAELEEAREDLKRDEVIFAEKVKEIKIARKRIKELEAINASQAADLHDLRSRLPPGVKGAAADANLDPDDLDISIAVAAAEPGMSHLMDDMEALVVDRDRFRDQLAAVRSDWEKEKKQLLWEQDKLQERLTDAEGELQARDRDRERDRDEEKASEHIISKRLADAEHALRKAEASNQKLSKEVDALRGEQESKAKAHASRREFDKEWLTQRIADLAAAGAAKLEAGKLSKALAVLREEREALVAEGAQRAEQRAQAEQLEDQVRSIDARIAAMQADKRAHPSRAEEINENLSSYEELRTEVLERIASLGGAGGEEEEVAEELEVVDVEIAMTLSRLQAAKDKGVEVDMEGGLSQMLSQLTASPELVRWLLRQVVTEKMAAGSRESSLRSLQGQLDDKTGEYESLVRNMQKMRSEGQRRAETVKREGDEKIAFLLAQLRTAEQKANGASLSSTSAGVRQLLASAQKASVGHLLADLVQQQGQGQGHVGMAVGADHVNSEVLRRYAAEKERREQLEKKNLLMAAELRKMGQQQR